MAKSEQMIDIAFGFDANYAPHAAGVMAAVVRHAPGAQFRFLVLHDGLGDKLKSDVEAAAPTAKFVWLELAEDDIPPFAGEGYIKRSTLFRLGLEKHAPDDCHRVLYLDADLGVAGDVRPLWSANLAGHALGAVVDTYIDQAAFAQKWGLPAGGRYFNAGILLVDLDRVRAERLFSRAVDFIATHGANLPFQDQDALNWAFWKSWRELDVVWNVQRFMAFPQLDLTLPADKRLGGRRPEIVHFMGADKPWSAQVWHPFAWLYWDGVRSTRFFGALFKAAGAASVVRAMLRYRRYRRSRLSLGPGQIDASIVIPTRNRARQLEKCLAALKKLEFAGSWEVIIIDNGSTDDTAEVIAQAAADMPASLRTVFVPTPGAGRARNAGCVASRGRIIAVSDDDCYVTPNFLSEVVRALSDERLGFVTGRVELFDPSDAELTINTSLIPLRYPAKRYISPDGVIGANLSFRREVLEEIGGYDERLGPGTRFVCDDIDAVARMSSLGWEGAYNPDVVISHHHGRRGEEATRLIRTYNIARGAYHMKYLLRGQVLQFLRGVASVRSRLGEFWKRPSNLSVVFEEAQGAVGFMLLAFRRSR